MEGNSRLSLNGSHSFISTEVQGLGVRFRVSGRQIAKSSYGTSYKTPLGRNIKQLERRTSNAQHRTSNIDNLVKSQNFDFCSL
jgi:hypothetical protein